MAAPRSLGLLPQCRNLHGYHLVRGDRLALGLDDQSTQRQRRISSQPGGEAP